MSGIAPCLNTLGVQGSIEASEIYEAKKGWDQVRNTRAWFLAGHISSAHQWTGDTDWEGCGLQCAIEQVSLWRPAGGRSILSPHVDF